MRAASLALSPLSLLSSPLSTFTTYQPPLYPQPEKDPARTRSIRARSGCARERAKLSDETLHVKHNENNCTRRLYIHRVNPSRLVDDVFPESSKIQNTEGISRYRPGYVVVHERDVHITNLSRRTPASRGGKREDLAIWGTGKRRIHATASRASSLEPRASSPGEGRGGGASVTGIGGKEVGREGGRKPRPPTGMAST